MNTKEITLLHSNDMHGDFLADKVDKKLTGGVSMLSGYLTKCRNEDPNVIYAIAGDMFRGSVLDSEFHGVSTIQIMNLLAPDVVTLGNHETDYGVAHLLFLEKMATFPIINANLYIKENDTRLFDPCYVMEIDGMKILFIGIITEEVISQTKGEKLIGSFIGIGLARLGYPVMDPIASLIIAVFILRVAVRIFKEAIDQMVDHSCNEEAEEAFRNTALEQPGVLGVELLRTRMFGNRVYVDLEIAADPNLTLAAAHEIAEDVHDVIEKTFPEVKHIMVHVNPAKKHD